MFKGLYTTLEKNLFNSLTKKLLGNISFIALLLGAAIITFGLTRWTVIEKIKKLPLEQAVTDQIIMEFSGIYLTPLILMIIAFFSLFIILFFFIHLIVKPIRKIADVFAEIGAGGSDLSKNMPLLTYDEMRDLSHNYNLFMEKLRKILLKVRLLSVNIGVESAQVVLSVKKANEEVAKQNSLSNEIFEGSSRTNESIETVRANSVSISTSSDQNLQSAQESKRELTALTKNMDSISDMLEDFQKTVSDLTKNSENIRDIVSLIEDISDQTNLLALNAAIEAARAGEAGRGFAVVADEVRKLAERVKSATEEISGNINEMIGQVKHTEDQTGQIDKYIKQTREVVDTTAGSFESMVVDFEETSRGISEITVSLDDFTSINAAIFENVSKINELADTVTDKMNESNKNTSSLNKRIEEIQDNVSRFTIGMGYMEEVLHMAQQTKIEYEKVLTELNGQGVDVFDTAYKKIPNTSPQKYTTKYDAKVEKRFQEISDKLVSSIKGGIFALGVDKNGYAPTHNSKFAKKPTGNPEQDMIQSRDKRMFNDNTGIRAAQNTMPFLMQTYARDTGEIVSDLSMPICVNGKHWGAFRVGFAPSALLDESSKLT